MFVVESRRNGGGPFIESEAMSNEDHGGRGQEKYSSGRSDSSMKSGPQGTHSSMDDHRRNREAAVDEKFAKTIVERVRARAKIDGFARVVWVAEPRTLGRLRPHFGMLAHDDLTLDEVPRDLCHLDAHGLHREFPNG